MGRRYLNASDCESQGKRAPLSSSSGFCHKSRRWPKRHWRCSGSLTRQRSVLSNAGSLVGTENMDAIFLGAVRATQEREIEIEALDDAHGHTVVETFRTPFRDTRQIDDRTGDRLAEIEER